MGEHEKKEMLTPFLIAFVGRQSRKAQHCRVAPYICKARPQKLATAVSPLSCEWLLTPACLIWKLSFFSCIFLLLLPVSLSLPHLLSFFCSLWQVMLSPAMQGVILAIAKARQTFDRDGSEAGLVKVLLSLLHLP